MCNITSFSDSVNLHSQPSLPWVLYPRASKPGKPLEAVGMRITWCAVYRGPGEFCEQYIGDSKVSPAPSNGVTDILFDFSEDLLTY